jgi:hypothetical protein
VAVVQYTFTQNDTKQYIDASARDKATVCIYLICKFIYQIRVTGNFPFM